MAANTSILNNNITFNVNGNYVYSNTNHTWRSSINDRPPLLANTFKKYNNSRHNCTEFTHWSNTYKPGHVSIKFLYKRYYNPKIEEKILHCPVDFYSDKHVNKFIEFLKENLWFEKVTCEIQPIIL